MSGSLLSVERYRKKIYGKKLHDTTRKLYCFSIKFIYCFFFLFIQKHIYNGHLDKMKKTKTKIYVTITRCKATITPQIKLKQEELQN